MKSANHGPIYVAMYPELAEIARAHGYALAIHGTLARDFDLICIPWTVAPSEPAEVVAAMGKKFAFEPQGPERKEHGRLAYTISVSWGECFLDLSFMPRASDTPELLEALEALLEASHPTIFRGQRVCAGRVHAKRLARVAIAKAHGCAPESLPLLAGEGK